MKLLLDTHTFFWLSSGSSQLNELSREMLLDSRNELYLSIVSIWELSIKVNIGKLKLTSSLKQFVETAVEGYQIRILNLSYEHCMAYEKLGLPDKSHRDPFDRMIICQALHDNYAILGKDTAFDPYPVRRIW